MAKQLYDYWFVQFDFPNEEGKPYKSSGGEMVWNEKLKREIPIDWEVLSLFDAVSVQYGFPFATEQFTEEETNVPVVRIRDILEGTTSAYSLEKADEKYHLNENDVLVGMDGNEGIVSDKATKNKSFQSSKDIRWIACFGNRE